MSPTIEVASLGMWDSLILLVMALVVFGPRRLPEIGRKIGKVMYEVRKASNDFKFQMEEELRNVEEADRRKKDEERLSALALAAPAASAGTDLVSQVPEAGPFDELRAGSGAPDSGASQESPYPDEAVYPAVIAAAPEAPAAVTYPQIQPPSTGAPVAAARPGSLAGEVKEPGSDHA